MKTNKLAQLISIEGLTELKPYFDKLPIDPYVIEGFRYKSIARYVIYDNNVVSQLHGPLFQPLTVNKTHGNISREYAELRFEDPATKLLVDSMVKQFANAFAIPENTEILVQFQRITCGKDLHGEPTIEGWHNDGVEFLGMICISRNNIIGGESQLKDQSEPEKIFLSRTLQEGEMLLIDDRKTLHYVTPIKPIDQQQAGSRDIIILCTHSCRG